MAQDFEAVDVCVLRHVSWWCEYYLILVCQGLGLARAYVDPGIEPIRGRKMGGKTSGSLVASYNAP